VFQNTLNECITITIIAITFMPLIFVAQAQEVKSQDNPVMQDRSWNLTRRSFEPPIQPVQQKSGVMNFRQ
jgi:hypothetical protein